MTAPDLNHTKYEQLAAGYALSALEPEEELAFRGHLAECERCSAALLEHSTTLGHLAFALSAEEPPASVLEGIRAGVRASRSEGLRPVQAPSSLADARAKRSARTVRLSSALVAAAASIVMVLGVIFVGGVGSKDPKPANSAFQQLVVSLAKPGARVIDLDGTGQAKAILNGGKISLVVQGLPVNDGKSIYVLWGKSRYGGVRAVGAFDVTTTKALVINDLGSVTPSTLELLMVTKEQGRKAPAVTTQQPIMSGQA
jgi:hypothetical protein